VIAKSNCNDLTLSIGVLDLNIAKETITTVFVCEAIGAVDRYSLSVVR
jgi:hypothetical protein